MNARDRSCGRHVMTTCQRPPTANPPSPRHPFAAAPSPPGSKATVLSLRRKHPVPTLSRVTATRWQVSSARGSLSSGHLPGTDPSGAMAVDFTQPLTVAGAAAASYAILAHSPRSLLIPHKEPPVRYVRIRKVAQIQENYAGSSCTYPRGVYYLKSRETELSAKLLI